VKNVLSIGVSMDMNIVHESGVHLP